MGFVDYRVGLAFVHKGFFVEPEHFVLPRTVGFLEKGCSTDWVGQKHFFRVVDGGLRLEVSPQHEGAPRMEFVLRWEGAPRLEVEFPEFESQT